MQLLQRPRVQVSPKHPSLQSSVVNTLVSLLTPSNERHASNIKRLNLRTRLAYRTPFRFKYHHLVSDVQVRSEKRLDFKTRLGSRTPFIFK